MIEIHRAEALAQSVTHKVLCAMELHRVGKDEDRLEWIRKIEVAVDTGSWKNIQCEYWIKNDPEAVLLLEAWIQTHFHEQPLVVAVIVLWPHSNHLERWDFDSEGKPYRVK